MKRIGIYIGIAIVFIATVMAVFLSPYVQFAQKLSGLSLSQLFFSSQESTFSQKPIHILLLAEAGQSYEGAHLTDSIMVSSLDTGQKTIHLISLPRDIWSTALQAKINTAYFYQGLKGAKREVEKVVGLSLSYGAVVDFDRFVGLIDYLGGIDVMVEHEFEDRKYPIKGRENDTCGGGDPLYMCRYQTVHFAKGLTHMNGSRALIFARSRNAEGIEGTDFARGKRQQVLIQALYESLRKNMFPPRIEKIRMMYELLDRAILRDIQNKDIVLLLKNAQFFSQFTVKKVTIPEDMFIVPPYSQYKNQYVLVPKAGDFTSLHEYIRNMLQSTE